MSEDAARNQVLVSFLAYLNLLLFERLVTTATQTKDSDERIRLDTLAAGHFDLYCQQSQGHTQATATSYLEPVTEFAELTKPTGRLQQLIWLLAVAGVQGDLARALAQPAGQEASPEVKDSPQLWRTLDYASAGILAQLAPNPDQVGLASIYARRVSAELIVLFQTMAARDTSFSNALSGHADDGLADLTGASQTLERVLVALAARLRRLGVNA